MKRISALLLTAAMVFGATSTASAVDVKVKGRFDFAFGWVDNKGFHDKKDLHNQGRGDGNDHFYAKQRVRTQINFIASENLEGVLVFDIGKTNWGDREKNAGGGLDADGVNLKTKHAYINWMVPDSTIAVRMGIQSIALPSATGFGSPIFNADVAAVNVSAQIDDMFGITTFWARPFDAAEKDDENQRLRDETDMFGLLLPVTGEGWNFTPWAVYAKAGHRSGAINYIFNEDTLHSDSSSDIIWVGGAFDVTLMDDLTFAMDGAYGNMTKGGYYSARGWFVDAKIDYALDWAVPGVFFWYSSGDKERDVEKDHKLGRMPVLGVDGGFSPTSLGFSGSWGIGEDGLVSNSGMGTWGVGAQLDKISFIEELEHTLRFAYYEGTNDYKIKRSDFAEEMNYKYDALYLTSKDRFFEINLNTKYQIYEDLAAVLELAYIPSVELYEEKGEDPAWKAQLLFKYSF